MANRPIRKQFSVSHARFRSIEEQKHSAPSDSIRQIDKNIEVAMRSHEKAVADAQKQLLQSQSSLQRVGGRVSEQIQGLKPEFQSQVDDLLRSLRSHILTEANETQRLVKQVHQLAKETQVLHVQSSECERKLTKVEHSLNTE